MKVPLLEEVLKSHRDLSKYMEILTRLPEGRSKVDEAAWLEAKTAYLQQQKQELERLGAERTRVMAEYDGVIKRQKDEVMQLEQEIRNETAALDKKDTETG
jgi:hypothetical protein